MGSCTVAGQAGETSPWGDFWLENVVPLHPPGGQSSSLPPHCVPLDRYFSSRAAAVMEMESRQGKYLGTHEASLEEAFLVGSAWHCR